MSDLPEYVPSEKEKLFLEKQEGLKSWVTTVYDMQHTRIQLGNRLVAAFYEKLGIEPGEKPEDVKDSKAKELIQQMKQEYKRITDSIAKSRKKVTDAFRESKLITSEGERVLAGYYFDLLAREKELFDVIEYRLEDFPVYTKWLKFQPGVGVKLSAAFLSYLNIFIANRPSSFLKYIGIDVAEDGKGRSWRKEHLVKRKYIDKNGEEKTKDSITYNAWLKSKFVDTYSRGIKMKNHPFRPVYDDYKFRYMNRQDIKEMHPKPEKDGYKGHIDRMACRVPQRMFIIQFWLNWRKLEGLEITQPYEIAKLGLVHKGSTPNYLEGQPEVQM